MLTQAEKRAVLEQDRRVLKDTFATRTAADVAQEAQGRFAKDVNVVGSEPTVQYPPGFNKQDAPHWWGAEAVLGVEPPLGFDINTINHEPVGEVFEQQRSILAQQSTPTDEAGIVADATDETDVSAFLDDQSRPPSPPAEAFSSMPPPGVERDDAARVVAGEPECEPSTSGSPSLPPEGYAKAEPVLRRLIRNNDGSQ